MSDVPYRRTFVRLLGFLSPYKGSLAVSIVLAVLSQARIVDRSSETRYGRRKPSRRTNVRRYGMLWSLTLGI